MVDGPARSPAGRASAPTSTNAGGRWVDEEVVVSDDGRHTLVTSRKPDDLDAFCREAVRAVAARPVQPAPTG